MKIILIFFFYIEIVITSVAIIALVCKINNHLNKKIKIDYVEEITSFDNYVVYQRDHFWEKWYPVYSCQDLNDAYKYAKNLSKYIKKHNLPNYL